MKQKKTIAVIDSGVDMNDPLLKNVSIDDLYYDEGELKHHFTGTLNMHGTEIIKVLLKECSDIDIISIRTLRENNKCMMSDIINAIYYCINARVDIINLSLGSCSAIAKRIDMLREACEKAVENGIVIFAADHNIPDMKSYPANFDCVIGVTTSDSLEDICHLYYKDRIIEFSDNFVHIPDRRNSIIRRGNSYLCPMITGLFCSFAGEKKVSEKIIQEFMDFIETLSKQQNASKVFFDKNSSYDRYLMNGKKILFFADDMDINNMRLYNMYRDTCDVKLCFNDLYDATDEFIDEYINDAEAFFFGTLSSQFLQEKHNFVEQIISVLEKRSFLTISVLPIIDTYRRICMTQKSDFQLKSIYK